jgi:glycosyltransferase involved in cell wall biosynthesis
MASSSDHEWLGAGSAPSCNPADHGGRTPILYVLTTEISSVLVAGQLSYLIEHGFDVTVGTRRAAPGTPPVPGKWDDGVVVEHIPFARQPSPVADLVALWATIRLVRQVRPTIVNASTPKAGLLGMLAAWTCRVPVRILVVRGFRFETVTGWRRRLFVMLERLATRCATVVIFNSRSLLAVGEAAGVVPPGRGEVLGSGAGNGIDVVRFADDRLPSRAEARERFGLPADAPVIGFVGRFTKDKGIEDLLTAFTTLSPACSEEAQAQSHDGLTRSGGGEAGVEPWLLLVGQFEDGDPIDDATSVTIADHPRIVTMPWVTDTAVVYPAMDVLAFPSYREGLPNVPLQAQLCGVPVVGYAATGTVDAVEEGVGGTLVPVGDSIAFRARLHDVLRDRGAQAALSDARRTWVSERFDQRRVWASLLDVMSTQQRRAIDDR